VVVAAPPVPVGPLPAAPPEPLVVVLVVVVVLVGPVVVVVIVPPEPTMVVVPVEPAPAVFPESEPEHAAHPKIAPAPAAPKEMKVLVLIGASSVSLPADYPLSPGICHAASRNIREPRRPLSLCVSAPSGVF
jgi:hypothetical protein